MNNLEKLGYILIGVGIGGFIMSRIYEYELDQPVGEIEDYIPEEYDADKKSSEKVYESRGEFSDTDMTMSDIYRTTSSIESDEELSHRDEFDRRRARGKNQATLYSKMYQGNVDDVEDEVMEYLTDDEIGQGDIPNDDEVYEEDVESLDSELVRERVESNFEVYLGENPQDFATLIFYQGDHTMTDDQERLVPNPDDVVGQVAISRLIEGGPGAEEGVIYVRNLKTMINYEIVLDAGSYRETVLGLFDSRRNNGAGRHGSTR